MNENTFPRDVVFLLIWRRGDPNPLKIMVTEDSWNKNKKRLDADRQFREIIYEFESPLDELGRKTVFQLTEVTGWAVNYFTGIFPT